MYNSYFGFLESPFSVTPDPRFFYTNSNYLEVDASLRYGIEAKKGFMVVTGEVGTGKTTLLRKLLRSFETTVRSVFIFNTHLSFPELLQVALHDLGLASSKDASNVTMLEQLNGYLIEQLEQGHTVAMLIDEAQNLSIEALEDLRLLSNLETDQQKLLQIVLMGQPELDTKLDQAALRQLKQRVAIHSRLDPLTDEEVNAYIDFRLRTTGYAGKGLFHRDAIRQIACYSKGIPRLINIICDNALLIAYAESRKIVPVDIVKQVARDLRIGSEVQVAQATPAHLVSETQRQTFIRKPPNKVHEHRASGFVRAGVATVLGILLFVVAATVIDPYRLIGMPSKSIEAVGHNQEAVPERPGVEVELKTKGQRVILWYGATIYKIAVDVYGTNTALGMDLIKEFNPHIDNLNWVFAGQDLILPYLTRETLLRQQPDGSYHLIVASFRSRTGADEQARILSNQGYLVTVTARKVSDDLSLHRVEIDGLKNLEEANQIWQTGLRNQWFTFADNPGGTR
jgi:general secretion pathway protein A